METEIWKDVPGYEGQYQVSNYGRVKSLGRVTELNGGRQRKEPELIMKYTKRSGYPTLILRRSGDRKSAQIHRLVAQAFIPNPGNLPVVNHLDYDRENNRVDNLEWCTQKENVRYSSERMRKPKTKSKTSNIKEKYIHEIIRKNGVRRYRVCIHSNRKSVVDRSFSKLEEAVEFRNEVLNWGKANI